MSTEYFCEICNYKSKDRSNYMKHLVTDKHLRLTNEAKNGNTNKTILVQNNNEELLKRIEALENIVSKQSEQIESLMKTVKSLKHKKSKKEDKKRR